MVYDKGAHGSGKGAWTVDLDFSRNRRGPKRLRVRDERGVVRAVFEVCDGDFTGCRAMAERFAAVEGGRA